MSFVVYEIGGCADTRVYIGYCKSGLDVVDHFMVGASRSDDRCDVAFLTAQNKTQLTAVILSQCDTECTALLERNRQRTINPRSFSGPTPWPLSASKALSQPEQEEMRLMVHQWKCKHLTTARLAYEQGLWSYDQMAVLMRVHPRDQIKNDLAALTPTEFDVKYADQLHGA